MWDELKKLLDVDVKKLEEDSFNIKRLPTGSFQLDAILGGGLPLGRIIQIYGPPSIGKSTLAYWIMRSALARGMKPLIVDAEGSVDANYIKSLGVDASKVYILRENVLSKVFKSIAIVLNKQYADYIVVDSVSALVPGDEISDEKDLVNKKLAIGEHAREIANWIRYIVAAAFKQDAIVIFINQIRNKIDLRAFTTGKYVTGGNALQHYSSLNLELELESEDGDVKYIQAITRKNKTYLPNRSTLLKLDLGKGLDVVYDIFGFLVDNKYISQKGAWYVYNNQSYRRSELMSYIADHLDRFREYCLRISSGERVEENMFADLKKGKDVSIQDVELEE